jgi:tRNA (adenine57-N1/adenine58-N1)-methyltransferase
MLVSMNIIDIFRKAKRGPQIISRKELGIIVAETGCKNDWKVVDAGTGSGFSSMFFANLGCNVYTYENDERWFKIAQENFKNFGFKNIKLKFKDVMKGIDEKNVDMILLDMKSAEKVIKNAYINLKKDGWLICYSLHIEQVIKIYKEIVKQKFSRFKILENIQREWQIEGNTYTRPKTEMLGHTGFLVFARK